jgi:hypothetical protein
MNKGSSMDEHDMVHDIIGSAARMQAWASREDNGLVRG